MLLFVLIFVPKKSFKMAEYETEIIFELDQKNQKLKSYELAREKSKKCFKIRILRGITYK